MPDDKSSVKEFLLSLLRNPIIKDMSPKEILELARKYHAEHVRSTNGGHECDRTNLPVSVMDPSVRTRGALNRNGISTLGELTKYTREQLLSSPFFGKVSLNEIEVKLKRMGFSLKDPNGLPLPECNTCQGDCPVKAPGAATRNPA